MGIFELETGILSSSASSTEVLAVLRISIELRRRELHYPPVANREYAYHWLAATGTDFRFSFKAPQRINHILQLKDCSDTVAELAHPFAPVVADGRMGLVLFQLQPNFKAGVARLDSFLADAATCGLRLAFEFRHSSWFCDEVISARQS